MRLPFLQVSQEGLARARTMARLLRIPEAHGVGIYVTLTAWAVEMAQDGDLSGQLEDQEPAVLVAAAVGWDGDPGALLAAMERTRIVMRDASGTHAVSGLDVYERALASSEGRKVAASVAARARWDRNNDASRMLDASPSHADAMRPDAKTQTQTQTQKASASQESAVAAQASDFELTSPSASKPPRKPSAAERLYAAMQQLRRERCVEVGETFVIEHWPSARINRDLGPLAKADDATKALFEAAWGLYLADDGERVREPAWSLSWFMSSGVRARYETRAAREGT